MNDKHKGSDLVEQQLMPSLPLITSKNHLLKIAADFHVSCFFSHRHIVSERCLAVNVRYCCQTKFECVK